jgi:selT/selW/selH-like putative selenoprotein
MYGFGVFFLGNNIQASLLSTGAFEMYLDGQLVYSKLATGGMPTLQII